MYKVIDRYHQHLDNTHNERLAAHKTMRELDPIRYDRLCEEVETHATYTVRRYGIGFYCWLHHPAITGGSDPWPASRMPKVVACIEIAKALNL